MLKFTVVVGVVLWSGPAEAIKWDFDDGTTQGWSAKRALAWGGVDEFNLFPGVVEDGVWRIDVLPSVARSSYPGSGVEVVSSTIGYDSRLFDRVRARIRTVHHSPTLGSFWLAWTNQYNLTSPGWDTEAVNRFSLLGRRNFAYTTEWQEVDISLADQDEKIWEGLLRDIRLGFVLEPIDITQPPRSVSEVVREFEIDWIELTGVEELLQGELAPPYVEYFRFEEVKRFAPPVFYSITPGLGNPLLTNSSSRAGVLTDLEGDGDLDLFAVWEYQLSASIPKTGWVMALNDGRGAFKTVRVEQVVSTVEAGPDEIPAGVLLAMLAGDLTGDGQDEIVLSRSSETATAVWSVGPELQIEVLTEIPARWLRDMADWDGDGDVELFVGETTLEGSTLEVWDVEHGVWTSSEVAVSKNYVATQIGDFTGDGVLEVLWEPIAGRVAPRVVAGLSDDFQRGEFVEFEAYKPVLRVSDIEFEVDISYSDPNEFSLAGPVLRVGDFDSDGQVDLLTAFIRVLAEGVKGLVVQRRGAGGGVEAEVLYDERLFLHSPVVVRDLNADGVDDWVFIGGDRASGFGVFVEWGGGLNPAKEVEWHRLAGNGTEVLPGDVDGDGDLDLVVLSRLSEGGHTSDGVYVLKSLVADQITAVQTPVVARPAQHRLGDSYPNPFNPTMVIPLDLATDQRQVRLALYDMLGRRVRQVWQGPLGAGVHRFTWDGRDEAGKAVAAGVYIYKVEIDGQVEAKKTTKLP